MQAYIGLADDPGCHKLSKSKHGSAVLRHSHSSVLWFTRTNFHFIPRDGRPDCHSGLLCLVILQCSSLIPVALLPEVLW